MRSGRNGRPSEGEAADPVTMMGGPCPWDPPRNPRASLPSQVPRLAGGIYRQKKMGRYTALLAEIAGGAGSATGNPHPAAVREPTAQYDAAPAPRQGELF